MSQSIYIIELVWNQEFEWVRASKSYASLDDAIKHARALEDMGDWHGAKKTRILEADSERVVWQHGQKVQRAEAP